MDKILFVGQAPSRESEGNPPFSGKCGKFLAERLLGMTQEEMLRQHEFRNVLDHWPGRGIGGDKFPILEATGKARAMKPQFKDRIVVLLGKNVARAFGADHFRYFETYELRTDGIPSQTITTNLSIVPHPSGVNRYWNNPQNVEFAQVFFKVLLKYAGERIPRTSVEEENSGKKP